MRVAFLGFGLITGSIARALRAADDPRWSRAHQAAWSPRGIGPARAVRDGVLDRAAPDPGEAVRDADLVILGAPPLEVLGLVEALAGPFRGFLSPTAVVTDVASTKTLIVEAGRRSGLRFVGGHPMAGREQTGYEAALRNLFVDRPWIVVAPEGAQSADLDLVEELARACAARPLRMSALDHDAATAAISHLPLVAAAALVEAVAGTGAEPRPGWDAAAGLAAGGWRDMTRLARGDVAMGAGIAATNAGPLAARIRGLRDVLDGWLDELERDGGPDPERLAARFQAARDRLEGRPSRS